MWSAVRLYSVSSKTRVCRERAEQNIDATQTRLPDASLLFSCPSLWGRRDQVVHTPLNSQSHSYHRALSQSRGGGRRLHTTACLCLLVARPSKHLVTKEDARVWVSSLTPSERNNLEWALQVVEPSETGTYE